MDFLTSNNRFRVYVELSRQGSNIEHHLMKDKLGEHKRVLQLVHADICGPMNMTSITGAKVFPSVC
jgi:hypothetical protein